MGSEENISLTAITLFIFVCTVGMILVVTWAKQEIIGEIRRRLPDPPTTEDANGAKDGE